MSAWTLVEHDGHIALRCDDAYPVYDRPVRRSTIWPGPRLDSGDRVGFDWREWLTDDNRAHYRAVSSVRDIPGGVSVTVYFGSGGYHSFAADWNLRAMFVETPIPAPRAAATHGWQWSGGKWVPDHYPLCSLCSAAHDPALPYCAAADTDHDCGYHHKGSRHVRRKGDRLVAIT